MAEKPVCSSTRNAEQVIISSPFLQLILDSKTGMWEELTCLPCSLPLLAGQPPAGGHRPPLEVGLAQAWLPGPAGWQVRQIECRVDELGAHCNILLFRADLEVWDCYTLSASQALITRRVKIAYRSPDKKTFWGPLFRLPAVSLGEPGDCTFLVPGQSTAARIPLREQAVFDEYPQPLSDLKFRAGIGKTAHGPMEPAPDFTPGIVGLHDSKKKLTLLTWFFSPDDCASIATEGGGDALAVTFHQRVEGWADIDRSYECGTQYIALLPGEIEDAYHAVQSQWAGIGVVRTPGPAFDPGSAMVYETSAQMNGGISNLARKLDGLQKMGVSLIYMLPIWLGSPVTSESLAANRVLHYRLDPQWQRRRVPHRIISHDALDPDMGTAEEMRSFTAEAHARGMRVLFDFVFHGVTPDSPLVKAKPEWFQRNLAGEMFPSHDWIPSVSLDWANPEVSDYFLQFALRNVRDFDIDGYRIDAAFAKESNWQRGIPWRGGTSGFGGVRIIRKLREELRKVKPDSILLCEHSGPIWDGIVDLCNDDAFQRMSLKVAQSRMKAVELQTWLDDRISVSVPGSIRILSLENHNSTRVNPSSLAYRGSPIARALFTISCFAGGVPLIWDGQEQGQEEFYRSLTGLRRSHTALRNGEVNLHAHADAPDIFVALRLCAEERLAVVVNCGPRWDRVRIDLPGAVEMEAVSVAWNSAGDLPAEPEYQAADHCLFCTVGPYSSYLLRLE